MVGAPVSLEESGGAHLRQTIADVIRRFRPKAIVLDLSRVELLGSVGVDAVADALTIASLMDVECVLAAVSAAVAERYLAVAAPDRVVFARDVEEAHAICATLVAGR